MDVIANKAAAPFYGNSECARCSASLSKGCYWVPNNEISKVAICEACYEKERAAEIPENLRELHAELYAAYDPLQQGESSAWKIRIPILIQIIERIASLTEQLRLSKAAYETNLATAEHNKRVAMNELNARIKALTEENERLKQTKWLVDARMKRDSLESSLAEKCPQCNYPLEKHCKNIGLTEEQENQYIPCEYCSIKAEVATLETKLQTAEATLGTLMLWIEEAKVTDEEWKTAIEVWGVTDDREPAPHGFAMTRGKVDAFLASRLQQLREKMAGLQTQRKNI